MEILLAINVYVVRNFRLMLDKSFLSASILSIVSNTSIGSIVISIFGGFGMFTTDFLTNYQTKIRIVSIVILRGIILSL